MSTATPFESAPALPLRILRGWLLALVLALPAVGTTAAKLFLAMPWMPLSARMSTVLGVLALNWLSAAAIVATVAGGFAQLQRWGLPAQASLTRLVLLVLLSVAAALLGLLVGALLWSAGAPGASYDTMLLPYAAQTHLMVAGLLVAAREYSERGAACAHALHDTGLRRIALDAELSGARLRVLQAQVEPHFLFNSLANLRRLVRTDPAGARSMIDALLRYLEEALPRLREERTTLAREAELVRAYLAVHQVRMGDRLRVSIDVPAELGPTELPPLLLLTLVENAIKHGLQPLVEGGEVRVSAARRGGALALSVADTGRGMGSASGTGTGLANLRAQLRAIYGAAAQLALHVNEPRGVVASITLPLAP